MHLLSGFLLGYIAVRCGSLIPTIIMHVLHNGITVLVARSESQEWLSPLLTDYHGTPMYSPLVAMCGGVIAIGLIVWFHIQTRPKLAVGKSQYAGD